MPEQENITQEEEGTIAKNHGMKPQYKSDLLNRLNGESTLDCAILACCESITNDPKLRPFYKSFDLASLRILQKEMVVFAIAELPKSIDANARIYLRHYQLFDMGFNESHFDLQIGHLVAALQEQSRVEQEVIDDVESCMGAFRVLFERSGTDKKMANKELRQKTNEEPKRSVGRSFSGDGLLAMFKIKREKRAKNNAQ
jgi:hypothetical protein